VGNKIRTCLASNHLIVKVRMFKKRLPKIENVLKLRNLSASKSLINKLGMLTHQMVRPCPKML
jgi:hypothetical protein